MITPKSGFLLNKSEGSLQMKLSVNEISLKAESVEMTISLSRQFLPLIHLYASP